MIYLELFWSFFQVGLFSIGGGYAAMPLIQNQVVDIHPWLTMTGFADIMAIAEMTPGPIALNASTFVGIQVAGLPGALIATIGCIFPSCVIVMALAYVYYRFRGLSIVGHRHDCLCGYLPADSGPLRPADPPSGPGKPGFHRLHYLPGCLLRPAQMEAKPHQGHGRCRPGGRDSL